MNTSTKLSLFLGTLGLVVGSVGAIALQSHAQTTPTVTDNSAAVTTPAPASTPSPAPTSAPAAVATPKTHGHAPMGGDGVIASINGKTIVMSEEADEGGASYTVDANNAAVTNSGAAAQITDLKVGDKIFVQGTVSGTNVAATSISKGHMGNCGSEKETNEAGETSTAPDTSEQ